MYANLKEYHSPKSVKEAQKILKSKKKLIVLAGGTHLARFKRSDIEGVVDLKNLNLSYIKKTKSEIKIGSATTINQILNSNIFEKGALSILKKTCYSLASNPLRNLITIGGNVVSALPWCDLPVSLIALNAKIKLNNKIVKIIDFYKKHPLTSLKKSDIITEIIIPVPGKNYKSEFKKFSLTKVDYAWVNAACVIKTLKGICEDIRIAVGAINPLPKKLENLEKELKGKKINKGLIKKAINTNLKNIKISNHIYCSKEYRLEILKVILEDLICKAGGIK